MSTRAERMGQRMRSRSLDAQDAGDMQVLTSDDLEYLQRFCSRLDEAIALLNQETAGIRRGQYDLVSSLYDQKAEVLKWLELRATVVEPFIKHPVAKELNLHNKLQEFKTALTEDSELLARMANAASTILREIDKVMNRNSLNGIYGSSGEKITRKKNKKRSLDQEI